MNENLDGNAYLDQLSVSDIKLYYVVFQLGEYREKKLKELHDLLALQDKMDSLASQEPIWKDFLVAWIQNQKDPIRIPFEKEENCFLQTIVFNSSYTHIQELEASHLIPYEIEEEERGKVKYLIATRD